MPMSIVATSQSLPHDNTVAAFIAPVARDVPAGEEPALRRPPDEKPARESDPAAPRKK